MHLYIHVPFCARRCTYCDFAIAVRRHVPSDAYAEAVLREWQDWQRHSIWSASPRVDTIYFGGGTPSQLASPALGRILRGIAAEREVSTGAEITLEANPDDVTSQRAAEWVGAGITRVSLGVQSFDSRVLAWMHRSHAGDQVARAVEALRRAGVKELSFDLIFGVPSHLSRDWAADLAQALALDPEHLSLYGLTVEDHTPLGRWVVRGEVSPIDDERYADEFLAASAQLRDAGYDHYEVSNAARPGHSAKHNGAYWRRAPFIGLGPSAHSGFADQRQWNLRPWAWYERALSRGDTVVAGREFLSAESVRLERIYLGLRTSGGAPGTLISSAAAGRWERQGWARIDDDRVRLLPEGWLRLDALVAEVS